MADPVWIDLQQSSLFVGSYTPMRVRIDPAAGLGIDDLEFVVPDGLAGGLVSVARGPDFSKERPTVMLLAGYQPGQYVVQAVERTSGTVVAEERFKVTDQWNDDLVGPCLWFSGAQERQNAGSAWGGGPAGPQNVNVVLATGTRRVAILFVDTASQRYTSDAAMMQGHRDRWLNEIQNGVNDNGVVRSARGFFREVSYNTFDVTAQTFGPVQLSGVWTDYFNNDGSPKGSFYQACFTAGDGLIDYRNFDTLLCVSQQVDATAATPQMRAWPNASIGSWGPYTTSDGNLVRGVISMPNEWGTADAREIFETFSHELGHNLGLGDQYTPVVAGRNPGSWEMMDWDDPFPHFTVAHRMMLGWVQPGWVRTFNFAQSGAPVDQTVSLSPIENGTPPAGHSGAIEVRIADGLNYYFEYRNGLNTQIADQALPTDDRVLATDIASPPYIPPIARPTVLLLADTPQHDGPVLGNGQFYKETDFSGPNPVEFRIDVSGIDGSKADVRVRYGTNGRPDPSIRPWPAGPGREWQSPDIEVRNARNQADPAWSNVPWAGNANTVVAKVRNAGNVMAPDVQVNFYVKNYNVGGAPETFLGSDVRDIAAGATVEFTAPWTPPSTGHYCIIVRIPLYVVPTAPSVIEMTELNNVAQSNYDRFISATGSPATREATEVEVGNPYDRDTRVFLVGHQTNPLYRTYVEHTWMWLAPGEIRRVRVMYEHALDLDKQTLPPDLADLNQDQIEKLRRVPNDVGLIAYIEDPYDDPRHSLLQLGGAQAQVATGKRTKFERLAVDDGKVYGVVTTSDGEPATDGIVLVRVDTKRGDPQGFIYSETTLADGEFTTQISGEAAGIRAFYLGTSDYAPCEA